MSPPYRVMLAGYRSSPDRSPVHGLSSSGCTVHDACGEGDVVLSARGFHPDLIVLCGQRDEHDGLEFMKRLKKSPDTENIPLILIVPEGRTEQLIRGLDAGADDCLAGSADPRELLARIRSIMRKIDAGGDLRSRGEALFLQASTDPLTGLYNRQYLKPFIERNLASFKRYNRRCSLVMLEIDNLVAVHGSPGPLSGDRILKEFGRMVKGRLRAGDLAVRYDKNTLVLVLSDTEANGSFPVAERLRRLVEDHSFPGITCPRITVSIGITEFEREDAVMDDIIGRAEEALVAAKREGKNRVRRL